MKSNTLLKLFACSCILLSISCSSDDENASELDLNKTYTLREIKFDDVLQITSEGIKNIKANTFKLNDTFSPGSKNYFVNDKTVRQSPDINNEVIILKDSLAFLNTTLKDSLKVEIKEDLIRLIRKDTISGIFSSNDEIIGALSIHQSSFKESYKTPSNTVVFKTEEVYVKHQNSNLAIPSIAFIKRRFTPNSDFIQIGSDNYNNLNVIEIDGVLAANKIKSQNTTGFSSEFSTKFNNELTIDHLKDLIQKNDTLYVQQSWYIYK